MSTPKSTGNIGVMQSISVDDFIAAMQIVKASVGVMSDEVMQLPIVAYSARSSLDSALEIASGMKDRKSAKAINEALDESISLGIAIKTLMKECVNFSQSTISSFEKLGAIQMAWDSDEIAEGAERLDNAINVVDDIAWSCLQLSKDAADVSSEEVGDEISSAQSSLSRLLALLDEVEEDVKSLWKEA